MVEHFDEFFVKDGKLFGREGEDVYEVEQIMNYGGKITEVTYFDGEYKTIVQSENGVYRDPVRNRFPIKNTP